MFNEFLTVTILPLETHWAVANLQAFLSLPLVRIGIPDGLTDIQLHGKKKFVACAMFSENANKTEVMCLNLPGGLRKVGVSLSALPMVIERMIAFS